MSHHQPIRVGIVGLGFGCAVHLPAFRTDSRFQVVSLCGTRIEKCRQLAAQHSVPNAVADWKTLVNDPDLDAISIAVPPSIQTEIAEAALHAGKHVFCEKPLADCFEAACRLDEVARRSGLANVVDFEFPEIPAWQVTKELLTANAVGDIRQVHVSWHVETYANRHQRDSWKTSLAGGGALYAFVSHCFFNLEWFLGPIARLQAFCHRSEHDAGNADVLTQISFVLDSGVAGSIVVSCNSPAGSGHRWEFYGSRGAIHLLNQTRDYLDGFQLSLAARPSSGDGEAVHVWVPLPGSESHESDGRIPRVASIVQRFGDWIRTGLPVSPCFAHGVRVQKLLTAAETSNATGMWVQTDNLSDRR